MAKKQTGRKRQAGASSKKHSGDAKASLTAGLYYRTPPAINPARLLKAMNKYCSQVRLMTEDPAQKVLVYAHVDSVIEYEDARMPAQFLVAGPADVPEDLPEREQLYHQSWQWPQAREIIEKCGYAVMASEFMSLELPYRERVQLFRNSLRALMEAVPCSGIEFPESQQFLSPSDFIESFEEGIEDDLFGVANLRFFAVEQSDEVLMDTIGMNTLGLPDLQCHFRGLDPRAVGSLLLNAAHYIYLNGDVIADGHMVEGVNPDDEWVCRRESSLMDPARAVIDLNPGEPHAAGKRK